MFWLIEEDEERERRLNPSYRRINVDRVYKEPKYLTNGEANWDEWAEDKWDKWDEDKWDKWDECD